MMMKVLVMIGLALMTSTTARTVDTTQPILVVSDAANEVKRASEVESELPTARLWQSRAGKHYKRSKLGEMIFGAFESLLHPALDRVLEAHPQGQQLRKMHEDNKVEISHHMLPMRDGVHLSTIIINPLPADKKKSTMISRSPYGPTSDQMADIFLILNGMAVVIQDQRGTFLSEGEFSMWHHDGDDGFDTLAWIAAQPWSNGKVFSTGVSADGCGSAAMILTEPPQLKGQLIMWASMDGHETTFPGGVFREGLITGWMTLMAPLTRGASLERTLPDILAHDELSDWWTPIQGPGHYHQAKWPTVHISGWWDIFAGHHISMFNGISRFSPAQHHLFVGPLGHCMLGNLDPVLAIQETRGIVNAIGLSSEIFGETPADQSYFRNRVKRINVFVQGSRTSGRRGEGKVGHFWSSMENWPEPRTHRLMLGSDGVLALEGPKAVSASGRSLRGSKSGKSHFKEGFAEFTYNPLMPMITSGGNNLILIFLGMGCGSEDQQHTERRPDVVVFTTAEPLTEPLALMGQMKAVLYVSTDRPDTDFFVSVTDVHPDGASMQIRYGIRRMKWRESTEFASVQSETKANTIYRVEVDLWFTSYVLAPGHRLRVTLGSSNTPYYAKSDNSGQDTLGFKYNLPATNRIYWSEEYPSHIELPVVDLEDLPKNDQF